MGMYSFLEEEDIKITDLQGLKTFLSLWKEKFPDNWMNNPEHESFKENPNREEDGRMLKVNPEGVEYLTFESWNNIKLISYWYDHQIWFLNLIARFLEGTVRFRFETDEEMAVITFEDKKCSINIGQMNWQAYEPEQLVDTDYREKNRNSEEQKKYEELLVMTRI